MLESIKILSSIFFNFGSFNAFTVSLWAFPQRDPNRIFSRQSDPLHGMDFRVPRRSAYFVWFQTPKGKELI